MQANEWYSPNIEWETLPKVPAAGDEPWNSNIRQKWDNLVDITFTFLIRTHGKKTNKVIAAIIHTAKCDTFIANLHND